MGEFAQAWPPELAARLDEVERRRRAPLRIVVTGHPGSGRATMAAALQKCFGVDAAPGDGSAPPGAPPADLAVHVLGAGVRACDREFLSALAVPAVVVCGKADLRGGGEAVRKAEGAAARELGRPVVGVSGLLAAAPHERQMSTELWTALGVWAEAGVGVPVLAAAFAEDGDPAEHRLRTVALREFGAVGLRVALRYRAACRDSDPDGLTRRLVSLSRVPLLAGPIRACGPAIAAERERRRRRDISLQAARGRGRDLMEAELVR